MSFDLYFSCPDSSIPSTLELKEYFGAAPLFQVNDVADDGVQFWYRNEATGVYCDFSYSPLDARELEGYGASGLSFHLNYSRPSFFAYETMPLVQAFCQRFNLLVEDPQDETRQSAEESRLIKSWRAHNSNSVRGLTAVSQEEGIELHYLPEHQASKWWRYMSVRQQIEENLTEDIFVPSIMILLSSAQQLFTMIVWPKGIAQFFPGCDYVYVARDKKRLFGTSEETGLVASDSVIATIGPLLEDYEANGLRLKYLKPDKAPRVQQSIKRLELEPIELSRHTPIASDAFHDVDLSVDGLK